MAEEGPPAEQEVGGGNEREQWVGPVGGRKRVA